MKYASIINAVCGACWAIMPEKLEAILGFLDIAANGGSVDVEQVATIVAARKASVPASRGNIAMIGVYGTIAPRISSMENASGGTSVEEIGQHIDRAVADDSVGAIVLDIDSPGGSVYGIQELSAKIFSARERKPIYAIANPLAASAAYWLATAATKSYMTPSGEVGSVGVIAVHTDVSKAEESVGVKRTILTAGRFKSEGNPFEPLGDDARGEMQRRIGAYYDAFIADLARNRSVSKATARNDFGEGRVFGAAQATASGMVDGVTTMDELLASLSSRKAERTTTNARARQAHAELAT